MVVITFPDREMQVRGVGFLMGRLSFRGLRADGGTLFIVPQAAVPALVEQDICFTVKGKPTYEQLVAPFRSAASSSVQ